MVTFYNLTFGDMDNAKFSTHVTHVEPCMAEKLLQTGKKLRDSYKNIKENRRRTMLIKRRPIETKIVKEKKPETKIAKEKKIKEKNNDEIIVCKAYNMNGDKCKCKAKLDGLCGRHMKKK